MSKLISHYSFDELFQAFIQKNSKFEGIAFMAVKTTGIFCRPTCPARKPNPQNVEFYATTKEALMNGYRPCKKCHPMQPWGAIPVWLQPLMNEIENNPGIRISNQDLRNRGLEPSRVRRWFKEHHGLTFQAYLRLLRISYAYGNIRIGSKIIESAFDAGYESLSGFTESFKKSTGLSPSMSKNKNLMTVNRILTPLGPMLAGVIHDSLCLIEFMDRRMLETQIKRISTIFESRVLPGSHQLFNLVQSQMDEYFSGTRQQFTIPLAIKGTPFQEKVWRQLMTIPYGSTRSYAEQAKAISNPKAVRAVARANGDNRIAIIIPCHRVIGKDGTLVGYGGGLDRKKFLLELEKRNYKKTPD